MRKTIIKSVLAYARFYAVLAVPFSLWALWKGWYNLAVMALLPAVVAFGYPFAQGYAGTREPAEPDQ